MTEKYTLKQVLDIVRKDNQFFEELIVIENCIDRFSDDMRDEMFDHVVEGDTGWDNEEQIGYIKKQLQDHIKRKKYVGAANFCMMLDRFNRMKKKKGRKMKVSEFIEVLEQQNADADVMISDVDHELFYADTVEEGDNDTVVIDVLR